MTEFLGFFFFFFSWILPCAESPPKTPRFVRYPTYPKTQWPLSALWSICFTSKAHGYDWQTVMTIEISLSFCLSLPWSLALAFSLSASLSEEWVLNRRCRGSWSEGWVGVGWSWIGAYLIGCQTSWSFSISTKWDEPPSPPTPPQHTHAHPWHLFKLM